MVGTILWQDHSRAAPSGFRDWLEQEIAATLGLRSATDSEPARTPHLVACRVADVASILGLIRSLPPVAELFFGLGRGNGRALPNGSRLFGLLDLRSHTQSQRPEQGAACLPTIDRALCQARGDADATLHGLDDRAICYVAEATRLSIRPFWQTLIAERLRDGAATHHSLPQRGPAGSGPGSRQRSSGPVMPARIPGWAASPSTAMRGNGNATR